MADPTTSNTSHVGYEPDIQPPVREILVGLAEAAVTNISIPLGADGTPEQTARVTKEDHDAIVQFWNDYSELKGLLNNADSELDKYLHDMKIPYDAAKMVQLAASHKCPYCGRPGAGNTITYADIQLKDRLKKAQGPSLFSIPKNLDEINNFNGKTAAEQSSTKMENMVKKMLEMVLRQIIAWVLEFIIKLNKPIEKIEISKIKIGSILTKPFKIALNRIKKNPNKSLINMQFEDVVASEEDVNITSEELAETGGGMTLSLKEVAEAGSELIQPESFPSQCLSHIESWDKNVDAFVRDTPYAPAYYAKKTTSVMQDRLNAFNTMAGIGIPDGYVIYPGGDGQSKVTYKNTLPEKYVQARMDGSSHFGAFWKGGMEAAFGDMKKSWKGPVTEFLSILYSDPRILCCLVKNLMGMAKFYELKKILLYIQAILQLARNFLALDISADLARLTNMILDLLTSLLQSIFSMYISFFNEKVSSWITRVLDIKNLSELATTCKPFQILMQYAIQKYQELIQRINAYLQGFFTGMNIDIQRTSLSYQRAKDLAQLDQWLSIINKILQFAAAWQFCIENDKDPRTSINTVIKTKNGVLSFASATTGGAPKKAVLANDSGVSLYNASIQKKYEAPSKDETLSSNIGKEGSDYLGSSDAVRIFLTSYAGISMEKSDEIIKSIDDCSCDKALTTTELQKIQTLIRESKK